VQCILRNQALLGQVFSLKNLQGKYFILCDIFFVNFITMKFARFVVDFGFRLRLLSKLVRCCAALRLIAPRCTTSSIASSLVCPFWLDPIPFGLPDVDEQFEMT